VDRPELLQSVCCPSTSRPSCLKFGVHHGILTAAISGDGYAVPLSPGAMALCRGAIWRERFCHLIVRLEAHFNQQSGGSHLNTGIGAAKILCVEPDVAVLETRCAVLNVSGYNAAPASPHLAEIVLRSQKFDLIVLSALGDSDLLRIINFADGAEVPSPRGAHLAIGVALFGVTTTKSPSAESLAMRQMRTIKTFRVYGVGPNKISRYLGSSDKYEDAAEFRDSMKLAYWDKVAVFDVEMRELPTAPPVAPRFPDAFR
jgi:hypothetical protein